MDENANHKTSHTDLGTHAGLTIHIYQTDIRIIAYTVVNTIIPCTLNSTRYAVNGRRFYSRQ